MRIKKAVFPVAGLGTRFLPATKAMPKEMLPVVDKPLIQYAVEEAIAAGIEQIIFVTGRGKGALEDHFDRSKELEDTLMARGKEEMLQELLAMLPETGSIVYTRQKEALGLGHAIWCAREVVGDEPFAVLLADDLIMAKEPILSQMVREFDRLRSSMAAVIEVDPAEVNKYGVIDAEPMGNGVLRVKGLVEKPQPAQAPSNLAIIGRYILTPKIFEILGRKERGAGGEIQLTDAMSVLLQQQPIYGFQFEGTRFDCGDKAGFQKANLAFALQRPELRKQLMPFIQELCQSA